MRECSECGNTMTTSTKTYIECPDCGWTRLKTKEERIYNVFPVSLKRKKPEKLLDELLNLCNGDTSSLIVFDIRRTPITQYNSASCYFPEYLREFLDSFEILYMHFQQLGNYEKTERASFYLTEDSKIIIRNLPLERYNVFLCYCEKEEQSNNRCHASWICNYLKSIRMDVR